MGKGGRPSKVHSDLEQLGTLIEKADLNTIKTILDNHGIDAKDGYGRTALLWSSVFENQSLASWLIENGANLDAQDRTGYTALHICGRHRNTSFVTLLLESGADPNIKDEHGNPPIWTAIFEAKGYFDIIRLLRNHGAIHDEKNIHRRSPDDMARQIYKKSIDELI